MPTRIVTLLTDYGRDDPFVGLCHAAAVALAPGVHVIDVSHAVTAGDVSHGALMLADTVPYLPAGSVHVAIVDPGVGSARRGLILAVGDRFLVGPDNGLLWPAARALGGAEAGWWLEQVPPVPWTRARTFDGRDWFIPAAAHLAATARPEDLGSPADLATVVRVALPEGSASEDLARAEVVHVDRFGNVQLGLRAAVMPSVWAPGQPVRVEVRWRAHTGTWATAFADVERLGLLAYPDAFGRVALAVRDGSAVSLLGVSRGDEIVLRRLVPASPGDRALEDVPS